MPRTATPWALVALALLHPARSVSVGFRPVNEGPSASYLPGAAVSTLRGPHGFAVDASADPSPPDQPPLHVQRISVGVELLPDVAVVEQTYTVHNPGDAAFATLGILQHDPQFGKGQVIRTYLPLAAAAWIDARPVPEEDVRILALAGVRPSTGGYRVGIRARVPEGSFLLAVRLVIQTVAEAEHDGVVRPAASGWSHLAAQVSHYSWGWAPKADLPSPKITTRLTVGGGVPFAALVAEAWTPGALADGESYFWSGGPWFVVRYGSPSGVRRAMTRDELGAIARQALRRAPEGHADIPASASSAGAPGSSAPAVAVDVRRARRALIVPGSMFLLLLVGLLYWRAHRRREKA